MRRPLDEHREPWTNDELVELLNLRRDGVTSRSAPTISEHDGSLRALAARLEHVRKRNERDLARIHDELGQTLTGIRMDLDRLEERIERAPLGDDEREGIERKIASVRELAGGALDVARRISRQLRPSVLDVLGVSGRDRMDTRGVRGAYRHSDRVSGGRDDLPSLDDQTGNRAVSDSLQEALTNVMRHAAATKIVCAGQPGGRLDRDGDQGNGQGFVVAAAPFPKSLGLLGMRSAPDARWTHHVDVRTRSRYHRARQVALQQDSSPAFV